MSDRVDASTWKQVIDQNGYQEISAGLNTGDPFDLLAKRAAQAAASGLQTSRVSVNLVNSHQDYNRVKVAVTVTVPCVTCEADISLAGEASFIKVRQMVGEASAALGLPPLE